MHRFETAGCLHLAVSAEELASRVDALLKDSDQRKIEGRAAREVVSNNRGAIERVAGDLSRRLED